MPLEGSVQWRSAEHFEVSRLTSGLTPWGHARKKEQIQTRLLDPEDEDEDEDENENENEK